MVLLAGGLLLLLTGYVGLLVFGQVRAQILTERNARLEHRLLKQRITRAIEQRRFEQKIKEFSWNGWRKFRLGRKVPETEDTCSFYLQPHDGKPLPPFQPGQYLTFQLSIPPAGGAGGSKPVVRCYSLSDSPNHPDYYRVTIKRLAPPRDKPQLPPGLASNFFHTQLKEGDILDVKAPAGQFQLDLTSAGPVVLIAGGIGVTPVLSMLNAAAESGRQRQIWFFYGIRNRREHAFKEHLERIAREHPEVHLNICYSDPTDGETAGKDYHHAERVSVALLKRLLPSNNFDFYLCGPPPMMNQITQELGEWGVPEQRIHFEAFGPATVKKLTPAPEPAAPAAAGIEVQFAKSGKRCLWTAQAGSLLELAEAQGVAINFGCRAGNCGTCLTAVQSGQVTPLVESGAQPEAGSCLVCISVPKEKLVLDA